MKPGFLYFAETQSRDIIKVGFSINPRQRISQLQSESSRWFRQPLQLIGILPATIEDEKAIHATFRQLSNARYSRHVGMKASKDWYPATEEMRQHIATLQLRPLPKRKPAAPKPTPEPQTDATMTLAERIRQALSEEARRRGRAGGIATAQRMTPEQRSARAKKAVAAREANRKPATPPQ